MVFFLSSVLISSGLQVLSLSSDAFSFSVPPPFPVSPYTYARIPVHRIRETRRRCNACVLLGIYDASDIRMERKVVHVCTRICLVRILISNSSKISPAHFFIPLFFPSVFHVRFITIKTYRSVHSLSRNFGTIFGFGENDQRTNINRSKVCWLKERKGERERGNIQLIFIIRYFLKQTKIRKPRS